MLEKEQNSKIIWNAISAYFMIFVSGMFLFNKTNPLLSNKFIKQHTKSALMIHLGFLLSYIVFISYWIWTSINIWSFALNYIIASVLCIILLWILLFWVFRASKWNTFAIWEIIKVSKVQNIININNESTDLSERDKLDILLSYIPFFSFYLAPKHKKNLHITHGSRLTLFLTVILILLYNFWYNDIVMFITLIYTVYVVFIGLNLFTTWNIIQIRFSSIFSPEYKFQYTHALCRYFKNYIKWNDLQAVHKYQAEIKEENKILADFENDKILSLPDLKLPKFSIYIPLLNLFYVFLKENKYSTHIRNGIVISLLFIITVLLIKFTSLSYGLLYLFVIISIYWIGYIHTQPVYKMPYVYMIYTAFIKITWKTKSVNAKYNIEKNVTLKVEEK